MPLSLAPGHSIFGHDSAELCPIEVPWQFWNGVDGMGTDSWLKRPL